MRSRRTAGERGDIRLGNICNTDRVLHSYCRPIPVPSATKNTVLVNAILSINASLQVLKYDDTDIEKNFMRPLHDDFLRVVHGNEGDVKKFSETQRTFVDDATAIIQALDIVLTDKLLEGQTMASPKSKEIWFAMAHTNFKLQMMVAAVEVRLSMLVLLKDFIPGPPPVRKSFLAIAQSATQSPGVTHTDLDIEDRYRLELDNLEDGESIADYSEVETESHPDTEVPDFSETDD